MNEQFYNNLVSALSLDDAKQRWREVDRTGAYRREWAATVLAGIMVIWFLPTYFAHIQARPGLLVYEPLLPHIPSIDVSTYINWLIYPCIVSAIIYFSFFPRVLLRAVQTYIVMTLFRTISIYMFPMVPPEGLIYLNDPFLNNMLYRGYVTKDLFFSGHTATIFLIAFLAQHRLMKVLYYVALVALVVLILLQHMHYTIDIVAAPLFVLLSYRLIMYIDERFEQYYTTAEDQ